MRAKPKAKRRRIPAPLHRAQTQLSTGIKSYFGKLFTGAEAIAKFSSEPFVAPMLQARADWENARTCFQDASLPSQPTTFSLPFLQAEPLDEFYSIITLDTRDGVRNRRLADTVFFNNSVAWGGLTLWVRWVEVLIALTRACLARSWKPYNLAGLCLPDPPTISPSPYIPCADGRLPGEPPACDAGLCADC